MTDPNAIDWWHADRKDISDDAIRAAISGTLVRAPGAADVLAVRLRNRCVEKIMNAIFGKYPDVPEGDVEQLVEDAAEDVVMRVQAGKLTEFHESPSAYIYTCCENELHRRARLKKGHEVAFSQIDAKPRDELRCASTAAFVETLAGPGVRPERAAIRREMLRGLGGQVGRLPERLRQVASRIREGLTYRDIARELMLSEATVRSQYEDAVDKLRGWFAPGGAVDASFLKQHPKLITGSEKIPRLEQLIVFTATLSQDCGRVFLHVHVNGKRISETAKWMGECRAATEALLLYAHWAIYRRSGLAFPRDFVRTVLKPHLSYRDHAATFTYW